MSPYNAEVLVHLNLKVTSASDDPRTIADIARAQLPPDLADAVALIDMVEIRQAGPPPPDLRSAWMALHAYPPANLTEWELRAWHLVFGAIESLVDVYDNHELADNPDATSAAADAEALYEIL